jgi:hypothetical protein
MKRNDATRGEILFMVKFAMDDQHFVSVVAQQLQFEEISYFTVLTERMLARCCLL